MVKEPRPEFANIMIDIGSAQIDLLFAYLNFGPTQVFITANIIFEFWRASASASCHCLPWFQTFIRFLRNRKISLSSRSAMFPNNHPSSQRFGLESMHLLSRLSARTKDSQSRLRQCRIAASCRVRQCQSQSRPVSYVLVHS